jgi:hypothetical protein
MYNFMRPVCYIPFTKEDINRPEIKQANPFQISSRGRSLYNPYPRGTTFFARDSKDMKPKIQRLFDLVNRDYDRASGGEIQYPTSYNGGQADGDAPSFSYEEARIWKVLAGDYLADKGFKIHDMLARYSAGLYKPPHRLRGQVQLTTDEFKTTLQVANMRIHVERDMRRAREFHILNKTIPIAHVDLAEVEAYIAFMLGNLQPPLTGKDFFE